MRAERAPQHRRAAAVRAADVEEGVVRDERVGEGVAHAQLLLVGVEEHLPAEAVHMVSDHHARHAEHRDEDAARRAPILAIRGVRIGRGRGRGGGGGLGGGGRIRRGHGHGAPL